MKNKRIIIIIAAIAVLAIIGQFVKKDKTDENKETSSTEQTTTKEKEEVKDDGKYITGLMPVDVYGNFEKNGFKTDKISNEMGISWVSKNSDETVETYSDVTDKVISVRVTGKDPALFNFAASIPYQGSEPENAQKWIAENLNTNAETNIGGVKFEMIGKNPIKILNISK